MVDQGQEQSLTTLIYLFIFNCVLIELWFYVRSTHENARSPSIVHSGIEILSRLRAPLYISINGFSL